MTYNIAVSYIQIKSGHNLFCLDNFRKENKSYISANFSQHKTIDFSGYDYALATPSNGAVSTQLDSLANGYARWYWSATVVSLFIISPEQFVSYAAAIVLSNVQRKMPSEMWLQ